MFFGLSAFSKKSIGLKNIPPPIPINPEISPRIERVFWPKQGQVQKHSFSVMPFYLWRPGQDWENSD